MADIAQEMRYKIDVKNGLVKQPMSGSLMRGDKKANRIIAELVDGDKTVSLDGVTVTGKFFRGGDGIEIPLDGTASGNEATVLLDEHCYAVDGYFEASVKMKTGGATRTILTITGQVVSDGEGGILDIENVVPSVADIVAQYQRMQEVTEQTEAATQSANTATVKANTAANNANNQAEAAKRAAEAANAAAKNWGNSTAANSEKLGGKAPEYYLQPMNLLDNSDLHRFIAQAGICGIHGSTMYFGDRWINSKQEFTITASQNDDGSYSNVYFPSGALIRQKIANVNLLYGKTVTAAIYLTDGTVIAGSGEVIIPESDWYSPIAINRDGLHLYLQSGSGDDKTNYYYIFETNINVSGTIRGFALYEGSYTADTLPPYVPKGYAAELAECRMYYLPDCARFCNGVAYAGQNYADIFIPTPSKMRSAQLGVVNLDFLIAKDETYSIESATIFGVYSNGVIVRVTVSVTFVTNTQCTTANPVYNLIADL